MNVLTYMITSHIITNRMEYSNNSDYLAIQQLIHVGITHYQYSDATRQVASTATSSFFFASTTLPSNRQFNPKQTKSFTNTILHFYYEILMTVTVTSWIITFTLVVDVNSHQDLPRSILVSPAPPQRKPARGDIHHDQLRFFQVCLHIK